jgi:hypothetical protein
VPDARRFVRDVLRDQSRDLLDAVELMASELATIDLLIAPFALERFYEGRLGSELAAAASH